MVYRTVTGTIHGWECSACTVQLLRIWSDWWNSAKNEIWIYNLRIVQKEGKFCCGGGTVLKGDNQKRSWTSGLSDFQVTKNEYLVYEYLIALYPLFPNPCLGSKKTAERVGWVSATNNSDILWSCFTIFLICSWKCVHLHIPSVEESWRKWGRMANNAWGIATLSEFNCSWNVGFEKSNDSPCAWNGGGDGRASIRESKGNCQDLQRGSTIRVAWEWSIANKLRAFWCQFFYCKCPVHSVGTVISGLHLAAWSCDFPP
jgi:hypothetical protein